MNIHASLTKILEASGRFYIEPITVNTLAGTTTNNASFTNQDKAPFLIQKIAVYGYDTIALAQSKNFTLNFKDSARQQLLMSGNVHASAFGDGELPTILPVPYILRGASTFQVAIANLGANALNVNIAFIGYKIKDKAAVDAITKIVNPLGALYIEPLSQASLLTNQTIKTAFTNSDNIPFLIQKITGYAQNHATLAEIKDYRISLKDSASTEVLMSNTVFGANLGTGKFPTILPVPFPVGGNATFEVDISSVSAVTQDVFLSFIGFKPNFIR